MSAALRFIAIFSTGYVVGFGTLRAGGNAFEAVILSLIVTSLLGVVGRSLEDGE